MIEAPRIRPLILAMLAAVAASQPVATASPATADAIPGWRDAASDGPQPTAAMRQLLHESLPALTSRGDARRAARERIVGQGVAMVPLLVSLLDHPDMTTRWAAVNTLGILEDPRAIVPLIERCLSDDNPHPRWRAHWALAAVDDGTARQVVWERLQSGELNQLQRWNAALVLGGRGDRRVVGLLHDGLGRPDHQERWEAVYVLGNAHDESTAAHLAVLADDPDPKIRRQLVLTLGKLDSGDAVMALVRFLDDDDRELRWRAGVSLARTRSCAATTALERRLAVETDSKVREHLVEAARTAAKRRGRRSP